MPFPRLRLLRLQLVRELLTCAGYSQVVPRHEHQIRKADVVADEVRLACLVELVVDDAPHSLDLVFVSVDGGRQLLGMELQSDCRQCCSKIYAAILGEYSQS